MKRKVLPIILSVSIIISLCAAAIIYLYTPKHMDLTYDATYYLTPKPIDSGKWILEKNAAGFIYYLYLPEKYKTNNEDASAKLPLIVTFHGSYDKGNAFRYGRYFIEDNVQKRLGPNGAAVLIVFARLNYFTDPHGTSLLIQNVCIKNKCIDKDKIVAYGHSQGAKFVVELACAEPKLLCGVISGSGFYQMTAKELLSVLPVNFYFATSSDDKGIFEQGSPTGKRCARFCRNSRYVEYKTRHHFWVELKDTTGKKNKDGTDETALDWLASVVNPENK